MQKSKGVLLDIEAIAALIDVKPDTVRGMHKRSERHRRDNDPHPGDMPEPTQRLAGRPVWADTVIDAWARSRPRAGTTYTPEGSQQP